MKKHPRAIARCATGLTRHKLNPAQFEKEVALPYTGAVVTFVGITRDEHMGRRVKYLEYEAQEALAQKMLGELALEASNKFNVPGVAIFHRLGRLKIGEASVVIAVSAAHRAAAFEACRFLIDTLKTSVPIFKKEYYADGSEPKWVGPGGESLEVWESGSHAEALQRPPV